MLIGSFLLLFAGAALFVTGLVAANDSFLVGAIVASLVAAVCLYAASRRTVSQPVSSPHQDRRPKHDDIDDDEHDERLRGHSREQHTEVLSSHDTETAAPAVEDPGEDDDPSQHDGSSHNGSRYSEHFDIDVETGKAPSDEPQEVPMSSVEAAALMRMDAEVMVVDGRPRFHLAGCVHLVGRDDEPLPAYEAVELGFSACALCRPAQSLLGEPVRQ